MTTSYDSPVPPPPPPLPANSRGKAVASLVLGIISLCLPVVGVITGILAVIFGIIGISRSGSQPRSGKGMAIAGLVMGICGIFICTPLGLSIMLPALTLAREQANEAVCQANLHLIDVQLFAYASSNESGDGSLPNSLDRLVIDGRIQPITLICPASSDTAATGATPTQLAASLAAGGHDSYRYVGKGLKGLALTPDTVLIYEPLNNHHGRATDVLFGDGSTRTLNGADAKSLIEEAATGKSPVYWPPRRH